MKNEPFIGEFYPITEHYGIRQEEHFGQCIWVLYRIGDVKTRLAITGRVTKADAVAECRYLEKLNAPKWEKGE